MAYGKRKKGGQRLMEMSRAGAKRKAARKATQRERTAKNFGVGAKNTVQPKKKVAAPKKKVAAPKSDAGKYMRPYSKRTTSAKRKSSGPAPLPKNIQGMARPTLSDLPGNILKGSAIAVPGSIAARAIGKKAIESGLKTEAGKKLMKSLTNVFKRKPKPAPKPAAPKPKPKTPSASDRSRKGWETRRRNAAEKAKQDKRKGMGVGQRFNK